MSILVTGGTGQLGQSLLRLCTPCSEVGGTQAWSAPTRAQCDLEKPEQLRACLDQARPIAIVHAGAYTAVDLAETEPERVWAINALATEALADYADKANIPLIYISTDYVFSGQKTMAYEETDAIGPLNVYGASKACGERAVLAMKHRGIVLRTSWVMSAHGKNFLTTMLRLGAEKPQLRIIDDQKGAPTSTTLLSQAIVRMLEDLLHRKTASSGIYHLSAKGETSWYQLARYIFEQVNARGHAVPELVPIATADYPSLARRPLNSRLHLAKIEKDYGLDLPNWQDTTAQLIDEIYMAKGESF